MTGPPLFRTQRHHVGKSQGHRACKASARAARPPRGRSDVASHNIPGGLVQVASVQRLVGILDIGTFRSSRSWRQTRQRSSSTRRQVTFNFLIYARDCNIGSFANLSDMLESIVLGMSTFPATVIVFLSTFGLMKRRPAPSNTVPRYSAFYSGHSSESYSELCVRSFINILNESAKGLCALTKFSSTLKVGSNASVA